MSTTCVCETYSTAHIYEHEVARRWHALPAGIFLPLSNGGRCQLLFAGRPGSAAGPDVQDAVLRFAQDHTYRVGDIEFHVRASDWYSHQHHRDARYNNVLLHVVLICDSPAPILRQDGTVILTCSLYDLPVPHHTSSPISWPCHAILPYMSHTERSSLLQQAGLLRFEQKAHAFVEQLHAAQPSGPFSAYDACFIVALAEGLGYGRDRAFFRAVGQYLLGLLDTVPEPLGHTLNPPYLDAVRLSVLKKLVAQWRTKSAWEMMKEIICGISTGLTSHLAPYLTPTRGVTTYFADLEARSKCSDPPCGGQAGRRGATCGDRMGDQGVARLRTIFTGIGTARSDILICNVVLPFALAVGLIENDTILIAHAQSLYQTYPPLSSNRITRAMVAQLQLSGEPSGACQQQGLHYIYQQTCKEKRCDQCIVGRRKL